MQSSPLRPEPADEPFPTPLQEETVLEILGLAHQYGFEDLESAICDYLKDALCIPNVCVIYDMAALYSLCNLKAVCEDFMDKNALPILNHESFYSLSPVSGRYVCVFVLWHNSLTTFWMRYMAVTAFFWSISLASVYLVSQLFSVLAFHWQITVTVMTFCHVTNLLVVCTHKQSEFLAWLVIYSGRG